MSKIKTGGLDQYGKVYSRNGIGGERVNVYSISILQKLQYKPDKYKDSDFRGLLNNVPTIWENTAGAKR